VHSTSDVFSYKAMTCEPARLIRAINDGKAIEFITNELFRNGPPSIDGRCESISIKKIICIKNNCIWQKYQEKKENIKNQLNELNIKDPLNKIKWKTLKPILNRNAGECWLFHGTNCAHLITQNGFTTKYKEKDKLFGYGALGKGIYLTDIFSKSSIYVNCPKCHKNHCKCNKELKTSLKDYKTILLSRVVLGNPFTERNNSLIDMIRKIDNKRYRDAPIEKFNSIWAPDNKLAVSDFDSNEFCVPEDQVYPEFCIFYEENEFESINSSSSLFLDINTWNKKYKKDLIDFELCNELEKGINDYHGLKSSNQFNYLDKNLKPLIIKCFEKISNDKMYLIEDINTQLQSEYNRLNGQVKEEKIIQLEIKIYTFYNSNNWSKTIQSIDKHSNPSVDLILMRGKCYFKLEQFGNYIQDIHYISIELNQKISEDEFEIFMKTSLICILNNYEYYKEKYYFDSLIKKIIEWVNKYDLESKIEIFRMLLIIDESNEISSLLPENELLIENLENIKINELGFRTCTISNEMNWQTKLRGFIGNKKSQVEMSWLNENLEIENGYLLKEFVDHLFESNTGYPKTNHHEKNGKKLVILLKQNNKHLAYFKFYPDYPLRQQAVDELCKRLSGYSCQNTLVKLKHSLQPNMSHPVLISEPLGSIENKRTLDEWQDNILDLEQNLDSYLFSWKFIEIYLIQPRDEKGDNLSVNKIREDKYYLVSIDSDLSFGYKFNHNLKEPNLYSIAYLSDSMKHKIHPSVIKMFLKLDLDKLLLKWVNDLEKKNFYSDKLFNKNEMNQIKSWKGKEWKGFCSTCNLNRLFTDSDLIDLSCRMDKLKDILMNINLNLKLDNNNSNRLKLSLFDDEEVTHLDLLKLLDSNDYEIYKNAHDKNKNCFERFLDLKSIEENFEITEKNNVKTLTSINRPAGNNIQIETIEKFTGQIESLGFYFYFKNKNSIELDQIENTKILDNVRWDLMKEEDKNIIFDYLCKHNVYQKQVCFLDLKEFDNLKLFTIIEKQSSLEKISIKNCSKISVEIFSKFSDYSSIIYKNYKCNIKTVYLNQLNLITIKTKLNIKYLYLSNLENLKSLEITEESTLKELYIDSCKNLNSVCLNLNELNRLEIKNENVSSIVLYFELQSIKRKLDLNIIMGKYYSNNEYLFNKNGIYWQTLTEYETSKEQKNNQLKAKLKTKKIFDLNSLKLYKTLKGHSNSVLSLIELKNGYLASISLDKTIKLWSTETGECKQTLEGHSGSVYCLIELKNGYLASGSDDNTIKIWRTY